MKKLLLIAIFALVANFSALAQTYTYQYVGNIDDSGDEVSIEYLEEGETYYFKLVSNGSRCYLVNDDGEYTGFDGMDDYAYKGEEDGMYKYQDSYTGEFQEMSYFSILYFSKDYSELYWNNEMDHKVSDSESIRYLQRVE